MIKITSLRESSIESQDSLKYSLNGDDWYDLTSLTFTDDLFIVGNGTVTLSGDPCKVWGDTTITVVNHCFAPSVQVSLDVPEGTLIPEDCASIHYYVDGAEVYVTEFLSGTTVQIEVVPAEGYAFSHWGDGSSVNPISVLVTDSISLVATIVSA